MAHKVDDINIRIRDALAWARSERDRCLAEADNPGNPELQKFSTSIRAAGLDAAIEILEEVVDPGTHSRGGPRT